MDINYYLFPKIVLYDFKVLYFKLLIYTNVKMCYNNIKKGGTGYVRHF